jgi:ABC-type branched-subunit amino acid transport system substrate-binding protein
VRRPAALLLFLLLLSCTEEATPPRARETPVASPTEEPVPLPSATIRFVGSDDPALASYEEGMRFALEEIAGQGMLDLTVLKAPSVADAIGLEPTAVIVVGDAASVAEARPAIEQAHIPVFMLGGDLYSSRQLFRYAFQTQVPYRWQARVLAHYAVTDRKYASIAQVLDPGLGDATNSAIAEEIAGENASLALTTSVNDQGSADRAAQELIDAGIQGAMFLGATEKAAFLSEALAGYPNPPQLLLSAEAMDVSFASHQPRPGSVACYTYVWSGWADMLPRVHDFRERFAGAVEHYPASLEQEGYDATRALADALVRTGGEGGDALVKELETFREETYSSVPVRLGPDDHVLAEESHLGLFAIEEPVDAALPPGEASSLLPWRPILRTFTTDGEKVNFLDRDKKIFFPFWQPKRPTPKYWRAEYGIVSRPSDPLH